MTSATIPEKLYPVTYVQTLEMENHHLKNKLLELTEQITAYKLVLEMTEEEFLGSPTNKSNSLETPVKNRQFLAPEERFRLELEKQPRSNEVSRANSDISLDKLDFDIQSNGDNDDDVDNEGQKNENPEDYPEKISKSQSSLSIASQHQQQKEMKILKKALCQAHHFIDDCHSEIDQIRDELIIACRIVKDITSNSAATIKIKEENNNNFGDNGKSMDQDSGTQESCNSQESVLMSSSYVLNDSGLPLPEILDNDDSTPEKMNSEDSKNLIPMLLKLQETLKLSNISISQNSIPTDKPEINYNHQAEIQSLTDTQLRLKSEQKLIQQQLVDMIKQKLKYQMDSEAWQEDMEVMVAENIKLQCRDSPIASPLTSTRDRNQNSGTSSYKTCNSGIVIGTPSSDQRRNILQKQSNERRLRLGGWLRDKISSLY